MALGVNQYQKAKGRILKSRVGGRVLNPTPSIDKITPISNLGQLGNATSAEYKDTNNNVVVAQDNTAQIGLATEPEIRKTSKSGIIGRNNYQKSGAVKSYGRKVKELESNTPEAFQSKYTPQIDNILDSILNRKSFDINTDHNYQNLYNSMKENYMVQGNKAMRDTIANASSLTGGYGNSYAQSVGQQAYDNYMQQLNNRNLDIMNMAYGMYMDEKADAYHKLDSLTNLDNIDYGRYRDTVGDYIRDRDYYAGRYDTEYQHDYSNFRDDQTQRNIDREMKHQLSQAEYQKVQDKINQENLLTQMAYQKQKDELSQANWMKEFEYQQAQDALAQKNYEDEKAYQRQQDALALAMAGSSGGSSRGGSSRRSKGGSSRRSKGGSNSLKDKKKGSSSIVDYNKNLTNIINRINTKKEEGRITNNQAYRVIYKAWQDKRITDDEMDEAVKRTKTNEKEGMMDIWERETKVKRSGITK